MIVHIFQREVSVLGKICKRLLVQPVHAQTLHSCCSDAEAKIRVIRKTACMLQMLYLWSCQQGLDLIALGLLLQGQ